MSLLVNVCSHEIHIICIKYPEPVTFNPFECHFQTERRKKETKNLLLSFHRIVSHRFVQFMYQIWYGACRSFTLSSKMKFVIIIATKNKERERKKRPFSNYPENSICDVHNCMSRWTMYVPAAAMYIRRRCALYTLSNR